MKKLFLLLVLTLSLNMGAMAQLAKTINVATVGTLSTLLTADEQSTITNLTVTGNINSDDFAFMKSMTNTGVLVVIDLGDAIVNGNILPNSAFASCRKLTSVIIPNSVISIGDFTFEYCSKLTSITIPNSVTSIGYRAFQYCSGLTSVILPNSITSTGDNAFQNCSGLTSITIPNSVTSIGNFAFYGCRNLKSITIPNSVTSIGMAVFYDCSNLKSITIPNSVTSIGMAAFASCIQLTSIKVYNPDATKILLGQNVFQDIAYNCELLVSAGSESSYQAADQWKDLIIYTLPNSELTINASAASLGYIAGSSGSIDITSNTYWQATSSQNWLTLSANPSNYYGNSTLTFTASANIATTPRTAIVTLTTWDNLVTTTVTVTQNGTRTNIGTIGDPYLIYTYDDLKAVSNNLSATYRLMADIDASASNTENLLGSVYQGFRPIGNESTKFTGAFHGHGHVIKNLFINRPSTEYVGLFGYNNGSIIDSLGVVNESITGKSSVGGLVGQNGGDIKNSYSTGSIFGSNTVGGLVGFNYSTINTCYSMASISGSSYIGGLIGFNDDYVSSSYSTGSVSGSINVGGLVGINYRIISTCYSSSCVSGITMVGGLVGYNTTTISNSYFSGSISSTGDAGGLVGGNYGGTISTSYWDTETSGKSSGNGTNKGTFSATGLTTAKMKNSANLGNLGNFTTVWEIRQDSTYAALRGIDNAPFAFRDTLKVNTTTISLDSLLNNDYDYETLQKNLVYKVQKIYGAGTLNTTGTVYTFPSGSAAGFTDTLMYRVGEVRAALGDTLWGNEANAVLIKTRITLNVSGTAVTLSKEYDGSSIAAVSLGSVSGIETGDNATITVTAVYDNASVGTGKTIIVQYSINGTSATNYTAPANDTMKTGAIKTRQLTVSSPTVTTSKEYDGTTSATVSTGSFTNLISGDDVSLSATAVYDNVSVGTGKTIIVTYTINGTSAANYTAPANDTVSTAIITARQLTISIPTVTTSKEYNGTSSATVSTGSFTNLISGDDVSLSATAVYDNASVCTGKTIIVTYTINGTSAANYTAPANDTVRTGIITTRQLTITDPVVVTSKMYDGTTTALITTLGTLQQIETVDDGNVTVSAVATYNDAAAGTGKTITLSYTLSGSAAGNYLAPVDKVISDAIISETITLAVQTPVAGCEGSSIELAYSVITGTPAQYQITFGESALAAGFSNISYASLPSGGSITINLPDGTIEGTYQASLQTRNSLTESVAYPFSFTINLSASYLVAKFNDVILVNNSSNRFTAYQWYKDGTAISGATGQYYNDLLGLSGSYYALVQTSTGESLQTCPATFTTTIKSAQVSLSAFPSPAASGSTISVAIAGVSDSDLQGATMDIINSTGATVYRSQTVTTLRSVTLNQAQGTYVIRVTLLNGSQFTHKIIVIK